MPMLIGIAGALQTWHFGSFLLFNPYRSLLEVRLRER